MKNIGFAAVLAAVASLPLVFSAPASASPHPTFSDDAGVIGYADNGRLYSKCRKSVRKTYGPVRGRHAGSIRIAAIDQCVHSGGKIR